MSKPPRYTVEDDTDGLVVFIMDANVICIAKMRNREIADLVCKLLNNHAETQEYSKP